MKKLMSGLLSLFLVLSLCLTASAESSVGVQQKPTYSIGAKLSTIKLVEGETTEVPLKLISKEGVIHPDQAFTYDAGTLYLTPGDTRVYYRVELTVPANSFIGTLNITNLTSGFSEGLNPIAGFSGSVRYSARVGNQYSASITGVASLDGVTVAETGWNYITWVKK